MTDKLPPALVATAIATGILGIVLGYFLGQGSSIGLFSSSTGNPSTKTKESWPNSYDVDVHVDSSDEELMARLGKKKDNHDADSDSNEDDDDDDDNGKELKSFSDRNEEIKCVLVVRTDLNMGKGKIAAQCGHATLACYKYLANSAAGPAMLKKWEQYGQPKIAVQVKSEEELDTLQALAISLGLCARIIHDAGRTQIAAGSATVLGVLGPKSVVDQVTGHLKLL